MIKTLKNAFKTLKNMFGLLHTWISIFGIAIPYLRPNKATNWNFLVPRGLFVTKSPCSSPFSPAQHNCRREESPNMWHTYLGQVFIFLKDLRRVIMKTEVRKIIFGHAVIAWIFCWFFYFCKIKSFGHSKVRFQGKKQKDMADDGNYINYIKTFIQFNCFIINIVVLSQPIVSIIYITS